MLRDITQAYIQSKTELNHIVIFYLPVKLKKKYPEGTILFLVKLLYGLIEVGNYWFTIYLNHQKEKLRIKYHFMVYTSLSLKTLVKSLV